MEKRNKGLVMSGGGSRGAWQAGVWKALSETSLKEELRVITGTSIGALNAAVFIQETAPEIERVWHTLDYSRIFDEEVSRRMRQWYNPRQFYHLAKAWIREGGLPVNPMKDFIYEYIQESRIRSSPIDLGLTFYNWSQKKGGSLFLENIPEGELANYLIASASFPAFQSHGIKGDQYLDGGLHDNIPVKMCLKKYPDLEQVLILNVSAIPYRIPWLRGWKSETELIELRPSGFIPLPTVFTEAAAEKCLQQGYEDGLKWLQRL